MSRGRSAKLKTLPPSPKAQLIATLQSLTADFDPTNPQQRKSARLALKAFTTVVRFLAPPAQAAEWNADATASGPCSPA